MEQEVKESFLERCGVASPRDRRNQRRFLWSVLAWAVAFVAVSMLFKRDLVASAPAQWILAALPIALSIVILVVFARFLREADELERHIQLHALALAFGGSYFAITGYTVLQKLGAPALDVDDVSLLMVLLYMVGIVLGRRRYR